MTARIGVLPRRSEPAPGTKAKALFDALKTGETITAQDIQRIMRSKVSAADQINRLAIAYDLDVRRTGLGLYRLAGGAQ